jgi:hypothetical protein
MRGGFIRLAWEAANSPATVEQGAIWGVVAAYRSKEGLWNILENGQLLFFGVDMKDRWEYKGVE